MRRVHETTALESKTKAVELNNLYLMTYYQSPPTKADELLANPWKWQRKSVFVSETH
jgi:hypothetical protein